MNKKLLTLAIGAALTSAPMFANAAVTVYGAAHLSVDMLDNGAATDSTLNTLSSNSSFIGFKAEEDLGGGMKALAGAEWQVAMDNQAIGIFNRNVFVGLGGGFGTVRLGQYDDVMKQVGRSVDLFMSEQIGESRALTRQNGHYIGTNVATLAAAVALVDQDARLNNSINYETPDMAGFKVTVNYGMANTNAASTAADVVAYALGAQYAAGPMYFGLAYKSSEVDVGTTKQTVDSYRLSASFKMLNDALRFVGFYQSVSYPVNYFGVTTDQATYGVGASYKIGNGTIKGQYYVVDSFSADTSGTSGANLMAIGYDHSLSKTTTVYVTYAKVTNDLNSAYSVIGAGHGNPNDATTGMPANNTTAGMALGGNDPSAISIGMKVSF